MANTLVRVAIRRTMVSLPEFKAQDIVTLTGASLSAVNQEIQEMLKKGWFEESSSSPDKPTFYVVIQDKIDDILDSFLPPELLGIRYSIMQDCLRLGHFRIQDLTEHLGISRRFAMVELRKLLERGWLKETAPGEYHLSQDSGKVAELIELINDIAEGISDY